MTRSHAVSQAVQLQLAPSLVWSNAILPTDHAGYPARCSVKSAERGLEELGKLTTQ